VLALLGGPVGLLAMMVAGGVTGGIAGHFMGRVIPPDELRKIGQSLPLNTSGFIVITEDTEAEKAIDAMKQYTANVVVITVGDELSGVIAQAVAAEVETQPGQAEPAPAQPAQTQPSAPEAPTA
jgi:uncharacterized membrane protein